MNDEEYFRFRFSLLQHFTWNDESDLRMFAIVLTLRLHRIRDYWFLCVSTSSGSPFKSGSERRSKWKIVIWLTFDDFWLAHLHYVTWVAKVTWNEWVLRKMILLTHSCCSFAIIIIILHNFYLIIIILNIGTYIKCNYFLLYNSNIRRYAFYKLRSSKSPEMDNKPHNCMNKCMRTKTIPF